MLITFAAVIEPESITEPVFAANTAVAPAYAAAPASHAARAAPTPADTAAHAGSFLLCFLYACPLLPGGGRQLLTR